MADDSPNQSRSGSPRENEIPIPEIRLQRPLPPLPRMRIQIPYQTDSPLSAYTDDSFLSPSPATRQSRIALKDSNESSPIDGNQTEHEQGQRQPPEYEPMYDYLRALALHQQAHSARHSSPTSNTFLSPTSFYMPYSDSTPSGDGQLAVITLSPLTPPSPGQSTAGDPPAYEELYLQHPCPAQQTRLLELVRQLEDNETSVAEEICKFLIGIVSIILVILIFGIVFNWGRPIPIQGVITATGRQPVVQGGRLVRLQGLSRLGSMTKVGRFKTFCGGRCKIHA